MKHLQSYYLLAISLAKTHKLYCQCLKSGGFCAEFCRVWASLDAVATLLVISAETIFLCSDGSVFVQNCPDISPQSL